MDAHVVFPGSSPAAPTSETTYNVHHLPFGWRWSDAGLAVKLIVPFALTLVVMALGVTAGRTESFGPSPG